MERGINIVIEHRVVEKTKFAKWKKRRPTDNIKRIQFRRIETSWQAVESVNFRLYSKFIIRQMSCFILILNFKMWMSMFRNLFLFTLKSALRFLTASTAEYANNAEWDLWLLNHEVMWRNRGSMQDFKALQNNTFHNGG